MPADRSAGIVGNMIRVLGATGKLNTGSYSVRYGYERGADGKPAVNAVEAIVMKLVANLVCDGLTLTAPALLAGEYTWREE